MHWALRKAPPPSSVSLQSSSVGCVYPPIYSSLSGRHLIIIIIMTIVSDSGGKSKYTCTHYRRRRGVTICTYVGTKIQNWRDTNKIHRQGEQDTRTEQNPIKQSWLQQARRLFHKETEITFTISLALAGCLSISNFEYTLYTYLDDLLPTHDCHPTTTASHELTCTKQKWQ